MKKKKSNLPKWKYDFSCKKCRQIHADDDRVVRCDCFEAIPEEGDSE